MTSGPPTRATGRPRRRVDRSAIASVERPGPAVETEARPVTEEETGERTALPPPWMTTLWNCECHTFEQVANQLVKAIGCSYDQGMAIAGRVHHDGKAVVRVAPRAECERVARVLAQIGLKVTVAEA